MMHSMHFIYVYMEGNVLVNKALNTFYLRLYGVRHMVKDHSDSERERNVLFNDALNTFYLWLYGVRHMVKDHSDSEKGNPLLPHRLLFPIKSKGSFILRLYGVTLMVKDQIMRKETCHHYFMDYSKRPVKFLPFQLQFELVDSFHECYVKQGRKEGNVLFNDTLTFYLRLYCIRIGRIYIWASMDCSPGAPRLEVCIMCLC